MLGRYMEKKTADKLYRVQGDLFTDFFSAVSICKGDFFPFAGLYPVVSDCHPVGITADIFQYLFGTGERFFGINHPFRIIRRMG